MITFVFLANSLLKAQEYSDSITVYFFLSEECKICQYYTDEVNELYSDYHTDQISFIGLFPNRHSTKEGIVDFQDRYDIMFPLKKEYFQSKTKLFHATITPEVVVYDEIRNEVLYQGRIDDSYLRVGKRKRIIKKRELKEALEAILANKVIENKSVPSVGCFINLTHPE
jgi:hypothetical protein